MIHKEIVIDGNKFFYRVHKSILGYFCLDHPKTIFYKETKLKSEWFKWGKLVSEPVVLFEVGFDIEDRNYSKENVKNAIDKQLKSLKRVEEILKGEII